MKVCAVLTCRMGSSRLPGKSMMKILGKPMVEQMVERVARARHIGDICIATTTLAKDDELENLANRLGIGCFRGSEIDVLGRLVGAVELIRPDLVVELLGDNPLVHSSLIDDVIDFYQESDFDYVASVTTEYPFAGDEIKKFPLGVRVQVFSPETLFRCDRMVGKDYYREHSTIFITENPDKFRLGYFEAKGRWESLNRQNLTFAVNVQKNLDLVTTIFNRCYNKEKNFSLVDVIETFDSNPQLSNLMGND